MSIVDPTELAGRHLLSRRASLGSMAYGLSSVGLAGLLSQNNVLAKDVDEEGEPIRPQIQAANPNARRNSHFTPKAKNCLLYTSPSPRDRTRSRMPSSA